MYPERNRTDDMTSMALFAYDTDGPYGPTYYITRPDAPGEHFCRSNNQPIDFNAWYVRIYIHVRIYIYMCALRRR